MGLDDDLATAQALLYRGLGLPGGFLQIEETVEGRGCTVFVPAQGRLDWFVSSCEHDDCHFSVAPHRTRNGYAGPWSSILWCPIESGKSLAYLQRFRPRPTMVLQAGGSVRHWALWLLLQPLEARWVLELTRRIAHRLRAPKKLSDLDALLPAPGTTLRLGRESRPLEVRVAELDAVLPFQSAREVAGWLPPAPDPDAWRRSEW